MILDIIEKKQVAFFRIFLAVIFAVAIVYLLVNNEEKQIFIILTFTNIMTLLFSFQNLHYKNVGKLNFNLEECIIEKLNTETRKIKFSETVIVFEKYKIINGAFNINPSIMLNITFTNLESELSKYQVLLKGRKGKKLYLAFLEKLYEEGVRVKEYDLNGNKSYLLKSNLSYKEIQEIKSKYNINWLS